MSFSSNLRKQRHAHRIDPRTVSVPDGWQVIQEQSNVAQVVIERPDGRSVTVDLVSRTFSAGSGCVGPPIGTIKKYGTDDTGRRELIQTAIGWLDSV